VVRRNFAYSKDFDQALVRMWENGLFREKFMNDELPG